MENFDNQVFGFGSNEGEGLEQVNNFNYNSISGLGESDYENEDLFSADDTIAPVQEQNNLNNTFDNLEYDPSGFNYRIGAIESNDALVDKDNVGPSQVEDVFFSNPISIETDSSEISKEEIIDDTFNTENNVIFDEPVTETNIVEEPLSTDSEQEESANTEIDPGHTSFLSLIENLKPLEEEVTDETTNKIEESVEEDSLEKLEISQIEEPTFSRDEVPEETADLNYVELDTSVSEEPIENSTEDLQFTNEDDEEIVISDTPIEELEKLTKYNDEFIENTDINSLFNKVSVNVQDASEIFRKNTDMKAKIDNRFEELKKLQSEVESSKQKQLDEINKYKEEVLEKLTEKKAEIEKRLNVLKEYQANLEKEKLEFEKYKKSEQANIDKVQKEVQAAYDDRREELNNIEDSLRRQKDELDEERSQLSLDRIQYEADKNELANNLLKFNELVNAFTNGVNSAGRE